jgi:uncharacterized protein (DUF302 family)
MNNFTVLKLTTGQDVICVVDESKVTEQLIEIGHPMTIISIANPDGTTMIFLRRYNLLAKSPIMKIRRAHIVGTYAPRLELAKYYKTLMRYHDEVLDKITIQEVDLASTFIDAALSNPAFETVIENQLNEMKETKDFKNIKAKKNTKVH